MDGSSSTKCNTADEPPTLPQIREEDGGPGMGWLIQDSRKFFSPYADRNKHAILEGALKKHLDQETATGIFLEVASGSGQHITYFAPHFPNLQFLPTEYAGFPSPMAKKRREISEILTSIDAYAEGISNILPAKELDVTSSVWPGEQVDNTKGSNDQRHNFTGVLCINMIHIAPMFVAEALYAGVGRTLSQHGFFFLYGPFKFGSGPATPESNAAFDAKLRNMDEQFGIRNVDDLEVIAKRYGLKRVAVHPMPANNHVLVYQREQV